MNKQLNGRKTSTSASMWPLLGGAALVVVAIIFAKNYPSIRRYIKIERM